MSKIKVKISTKETNQIYEAIYRESEDLIVYKESENALMKYDFKNNILNRRTPDFTAIFDFNNSICNVNIQNNNRSMEIPIKIHKKNINTNSIEIEYEIEEETIYYKLEVLK